MTRYRAYPLAWLECDGRRLALNQARPRWAVLNAAAERLLRLCHDDDGNDGDGVTAAELGARHRRRHGPLSDDEAGAALAALAAAGLVTDAPEAAAPPPSFADYAVEHLYVELLARCNLRCVHCYMEGAPERTEALAFGDVERVLGELRASGGRYVTLSGGEPLLYPRYADVVEAAAGLGLRITVISNGLLLRARHLEQLARHDANLALSLDGVSAATNDAIRGAGTHARIVAALDRAVAALGPERVVLSFTPVRRNLAELPALFAFAVAHGVRRLNLSLIEGVGRALQHPGLLELDEGQREAAVEAIFLNAVEHIGRLEVDLNDTRNVLELFSPERRPADLHPLWRGVRLDSRGDLYPSTFGAAPEFRLGNIGERPLAELVRAPLLRDLYEQLHDRFRRTPRCRSCAWSQICRGGGVTSAYYASGDLFMPDAYCSGYLKTLPRVALALADLPEPRA